MPDIEQEKLIGQVSHYFAHAGVGAIKLSDGELNLGDTIHVKGAHTDFRQRVESLEVDHHRIEHADKGNVVGVKVAAKVREHDRVFVEIDYRSFGQSPC